MRLISFIIATYITLLTVQPVLSVLSVMSNSEKVECCSSLCNNEQSQKKNNKPEDCKQCNPFQSCSSCYGFIITEFSIHENIIFNDFENVQTKYLEIKKTGFFSNHFEPPEII